MKKNLIASLNAHSETKKYLNEILKAKLNTKKLSAEKVKVIKEMIVLNTEKYLKKYRV